MMYTVGIDRQRGKQPIDGMQEGKKHRFSTKPPIYKEKRK